MKIDPIPQRPISTPPKPVQIEKGSSLINMEELLSNKSSEPVDSL